MADEKRIELSGGGYVECVDHTKEDGEIVILLKCGFKGSATVVRLSSMDEWQAVQELIAEPHFEEAKDPNPKNCECEQPRQSYPDHVCSTD